MTGSDPVIKQCTDIILSPAPLQDKLEAADVMVAMIEILPYTILKALQQISGVLLSDDEVETAKKVAFGMVDDQPTMIAQAEKWQRIPELAVFASAVARALMFSSDSQKGE